MPVRWCFSRAVNNITFNVAHARSAGYNQDFSGRWQWFGQYWDWERGVWKSQDMQWPAIASGADARCAVAIPDLAADVHLFESTNGGLSFSDTLITTAGSDTLDLPEDVDSLATIFLPWQNVDIVYKGAEPHIVWTALQGARDPRYGLLLYDYRSRILHWSASTGIDTVVVSRYQGAVPSEPETFVRTGANHTAVDWPQIGVSEDGDVLYVVYVGFSPNDVDPTNNISFGDIMGVCSTDGGNSWSDPQNLTNPDGSYPGMDDRYPSISPANNGAGMEPGMDAYIVYQADATAGSFVIGEEPLDWDYLVFTGVAFDVPANDVGGERGTPLPKTVRLLQNYPNPFNPHTHIRFEITERAQTVRCAIYDCRGRHVRTLLAGELEAGEHEVVWDGRDDSGRELGSGVFFSRLSLGGRTFTRKMLLLR